MTRWESWFLVASALMWAVVLTGIAVGAWFGDDEEDPS